jgi:2-polyprenyl-3-methyl-5-hydroxy-6-metoxy-1,4-benzoquinol methylase
LVQVREFPHPHELATVYGESYYRSPASHVVGYDNYEADEANILATASRRLREISRYKTGPGRLLDVGCALGYFMDAARGAGWETIGIELSDYAADHARRRGGATVHVGELSHAALPESGVDVITLWDVVEHMADPLTQLRECRRVIKPNGLLAMSTPDIGSSVAKLTGERWMGFKLADEHLFYFSRSTATQLLEMSGFEVVRAFSVGKCITLSFFVKRLGLYLPRVAGVLGRLVSDTRLGRMSIYVNAGDIVCLLARPIPGPENPGGGHPA